MTKLLVKSMKSEYKQQYKIQEIHKKWFLIILKDRTLFFLYRLLLSRKMPEAHKTKLLPYLIIVRFNVSFRSLSLCCLQSSFTFTNLACVQHFIFLPLSLSCFYSDICFFWCWNTEALVGFCANSAVHSFETRGQVQFYVISI